MKYFKYGIILIFIIFLFVFLVNRLIIKDNKNLIFSELNKTPKKQTALVLGARVYDNGSMSSILSDRVKTAIELYKLGKVEKILLSGDHGTKEYDEVNAMKDYLLKNNVKEEDIFTDYAGFDTYDSVYRAKAIFQVESMIIVTQEFHLPRAIYLARKLGIDTIGFKADKQKYQYMRRNEARESLARVKAFIDIKLKSEPKFLGDTILIIGDGRESWD